MKMSKKRKVHPIKKSGTFEGKSNTLGHGGRAAQLKAQGVPGGVIGALARRAHAAPGQKNFHGKKKVMKHHKKHKKSGLRPASEVVASEQKASHQFYKHKKTMCKTHHKVMCKLCKTHK